MKKLLLISFLCMMTVVVVGQEKSMGIPNVDIKSTNGKKIKSTDLIQGKPTVISFWATWCKPCIKELGAIQEALPDWKEEVDFDMIAISIDDSRSEHRVAPFANGRGWEFDVYLDPNQDLKRALNIANIPHTFLFDKTGQLIWQHSGYNEGDEEELYDQLLIMQDKQ